MESRIFNAVQNINLPWPPLYLTYSDENTHSQRHVNSAEPFVANSTAFTPHFQNTPADSLTNSEQKRKRAALACDVCFKRKTKCISTNGMDCTTCQSNGFPCTYSRDLKRRGPKAVNPFSGVVNETPKFHLLDLYFSFFYPIFPIIPKQLFLKNVWDESPILLQSMYAVSARYQQMTSSLTKVDIFDEGLMHFQLAREMLEKSLNQPSISLIIALKLMGHFSLKIDQGI
jgi:hypothetical protein